MNLVRGNVVIVFAILVIAGVILFPKPGRAQNLVSGEFRLSQELRWENSVLPMGDYTYFVDSDRWPAVVRVQQEDGNFSGVFIPQSILKLDKSHSGEILVANEGSDSYILSIYIKDLGGELFFSAPAAGTGSTRADPRHGQKAMASPVRTLEYLTILNPNREKVSEELAEKVYVRACAAVAKEFNRPFPHCPRLVLRLGTNDNLLQYPTREIQLKKWDERRFADAVVDLALHDLVTPEERVRLSRAAVDEAGATVNICELKACVN